ncbi:MAG: MBL fold metallo-hydrolase, partial [Desulfuromonas sp.]
VYTKLFSILSAKMKMTGLKHIFFSHQDPDIIAAANGWLMMTDASAYLSALWMRFIPHFGVDELVVERIRPIPDAGMTLQLGSAELKIIPAHYLHSAGNFHLYDPVSKILYTGDLGASLETDYSMVEDFDAHVASMEGFHKRYMANSRAVRTWVNTVRQLDIEMIAPQHGAMFPNRELSQKFISWIAGLTCGTDLLPERYDIPA